MFHKLLHRGLPGWFDFNSVYAMQPMYTSQANQKILSKLGTIDQFSRQAPTAPIKPRTVDIHKTIVQLLDAKQGYQPTWTPSREVLTPPGLVTRFNSFQQNLLGDQIYKSVDAKGMFLNYVVDKAGAYLERDAFLLGKSWYQVDFVRE